VAAATAMQRGASSYPKVVDVIRKIVAEMVPRACGRGFSGAACEIPPCCSSCSGYCAVREGTAQACNATQKTLQQACNCGPDACKEMCSMSTFCTDCNKEC
jgi:hypothetical protein